MLILKERLWDLSRAIVFGDPLRTCGNSQVEIFFIYLESVYCMAPTTVSPNLYICRVNLYLQVSHPLYTLKSQGCQTDTINLSVLEVF